jgi:hypothetical protein
MLRIYADWFENDRGVSVSCGRATSSERGAGKFTLFVFAALAGIAVYIVAQVGPIFYSHMELQNQLQQAARVAATKDDAELRKLIAPHLRDLEIPATIDSLVIERFEGYIYIGISYSETLTIPLGEKDLEIYTFQFAPYAEEDL